MLFFKIMLTWADIIFIPPPTLLQVLIMYMLNYDYQVGGCMSHLGLKIGVQRGVQPSH